MHEQKCFQYQEGETQLKLALSGKGIYWLTLAVAAGNSRAAFRHEGSRGSDGSPASCPSLSSSRCSFSLCYLHTLAALSLASLLCKGIS